MKRDGYVNLARLGLAALLAASLTACGPKSGGDGAGTGDGKAAKGPAPTEKVVVMSDDGVEIHADYYMPDGASGAPAIILLHMYCHDRKIWAPLIPSLLDAGFLVLNVDMRGHGESTKKGDEVLKCDTLQKHPDGNQFESMHLDVRAAKAWLDARPELDGSRVGIVSASVGTSVTIDYLSRYDDVKAAVLLTPGKNYLGMPTEEHIKGVTEPFLAFTSEKERAGSDMVTAAEPPEGAAARDMEVKDGVGHGTKMFPDWPELVGKITDYVKANVAGM